MSAVYSPRWYRVAGLKPRLAGQLQVRRQHLRGQTWYLLALQGSHRSVRLNPAAYAIAGRFDGGRTVQQLWDQLLAGDADPPTQDEVIDLLERLREALLLQLGSGADAERLLAHDNATGRPRQRRSLLAWRIKLGDPSALLDRLAPLARLLFSPVAAFLWVLAATLLVVLALQHAPSLMAHGRAWLGTPRDALLALLLYVPIKLLHELAHGLAVRRWGGTVREAGVTLMLGLPVPWVDASAATAFDRRFRRIVVGAAGMMAELALAAVALPLWLWLPEGLLREMAFVTLFIAGVSTLLFNANPLQRLDGYYIATDLLALPNLGPRSRQWWLDLLRRRLLHTAAAEPMVVAAGERPWLMAYAPLSWAYGVFVAALAAVWLGQVSFALGVLAAVLLGWQSALRPLIGLLGALRRAALGQQATARRWRRIVGTGAAAAVLLMLLPLPQRSQLQGVVWPSDDAQLRAEEDGFVTALELADGAQVVPGDVVLRLSNPALQTALARQTAQVAALESELVQALPGRARGSDEVPEPRAGDAQAELARAQGELDRLHERESALTVRAGAAGRLALPQAADLPGSYLRRGSLFGQVLTGAPPTVRVALPESEAAEWRDGPPALAVRLAASRGEVHRARLLRDGAGAVWQLPSAALSQRHGGAIVTDPQDSHDLKPQQPVVLLDLQLQAAADTPARLGERAWVRLDRGFAPLSWQLLGGLQRALRQRFNPQF